MNKKVLLIGLDSAPPEFVLDRFLDTLPNIKMMVERGLSGSLRTVEPPITVPAWQCMVTGKDPGALGLYGFRHRKGNSYTDYRIANSRSIEHKRIWDILAEEGRKSCLVGVPPSYPPQKIKGNLVSCFITPSLENYTYPEDLKAEIEDLVGEYKFDVVFRTEDRDRLLEEIYEMTEKRFAVIGHLLRNKEWDFFMSVEIGLDRLHHAFWKYFDSNHHLYEPGSKYESVIQDYYLYLDKKIGELLQINEWLIREGYLVLKTPPKEPVDLGKVEIDWTKTRAWAWGGYYSRIFVNLKGREAMGVVEKSDFFGFLDELKQGLSRIPGPDGSVLKNKILRPDELYSKANGDAPDLMASFDDYYYRAAGTVGHTTLFLKENDTGPDDSMHSMDGVIIIYDPKKQIGARINEASILDVAPTVLHLIGCGEQIEDSLGKILKEVT
jgi:predicted AlkP superfamily phosphohydrolase/phosphomutase